MIYTDLDRTAEHDQLGVCPRPQEWQARHGQFRKFEAIHLGPEDWNSHPQVETLIRELEHVFCAGAWVATIVIAQAVVEVSLAAFNKGGLKSLDFLNKYQLKAKVEWLRDRRNPILHRHSGQGAAIPLDQQLLFRETLRLDAKKAVAYALEVSFLPSRHTDAQ